MAANRVFLRDDGIVEIHVVGVQNAASVELMGREVSTLLSYLRAKKKPCLVLDDLLDIGPVDQGGRNKVVELGKRLDFDKAAMVGKGALLRMGANLMLHATGRADKMKFFENRDDALSWLTEV